MARLAQNASYLCPKYADLRFCSTEFVASIRVLKFNESATAFWSTWVMAPNPFFFTITRRVVYKVNCLDYDFVYYGQTDRALVT